MHHDGGCDQRRHRQQPTQRRRVYDLFRGGSTLGTSCDVTNNVFVGHVYGTVVGEAEGSQTYSGNVYSDTAVKFGSASAVRTGSTSAPLVVAVDTVAPAAPTIATPTTNANGGLDLKGTAEANSVVTVYDGTNQIGTATANASGVWGYSTGALATGSHSLTAQATDTAGNTGAASGVVTASTGNLPAPAAPKINTFSNDSGTAGDGVTNDNTLTLTGTAAAGSTVKIFDGTALVGAATANGSGAWSLTTTTLADGNHSLTARVTDSSGQTSATSSTLAVTIDTTAPTAPQIGSYMTDGGVLARSAIAGVTDADHLILNGTAEANSTVSVFDGTTQIGSTRANSSGVVELYRKQPCGWQPQLHVESGGCGWQCQRDLGGARGQRGYAH